MIHYQKNKAGFWLGMCIAIPLTLFSAWRDFDLFSLVLPAGQIFAAYFGLAALDGGFIGWIFGYTKAKGSDQRGVSGTLIVVCFIGMILGMFLDLYISLVDKGFLSTNRGNIYVGAIVLIVLSVAINIGGGALYGLADPKTKQEIRDQKAHDKINDLADAQIEQHAAMYAPEFARAKVDMWLLQARMIHGLAPSQLSALPQAPVVPSLPPAQIAQPAQQQQGFNPLAAVGKIFGLGQGQPPAQATSPQPALTPEMMAFLQQQMQQSQTNVPNTSPLNLPYPEEFVNDLIASVQQSPKAQAPSPNGAKLNGNSQK